MEKTYKEIGVIDEELLEEIETMRDRVVFAIAALDEFESELENKVITKTWDMIYEQYPEIAAYKDRNLRLNVSTGIVTLEVEDTDTEKDNTKKGEDGK